jgi:hypothetical protein
MAFLSKQGSRYKNLKVALSIVKNFNGLVNCTRLTKNYTFHLHILNTKF